MVKFLENSALENEKLFVGERHSDRKRRHRRKKIKLFHLNKKAAEMRQIQQASSTKDCKNCLRRHYKQVKANS